MRAVHRVAGVVAGLLLPLSIQAAELQARLVHAGTVVLGTPVSGVIERVGVAPGQRVEAGEELLRLEQSGFAAELAAAEARQQATAMARDEAREEYQRARTLFDRTQLSEHELQMAENAAAHAEADYREAQAAAVRQRQNRDWSRLVAPAAGEVVAVDAHPGQAVVSQHLAPQLVTLELDGGLRGEAHLPLESGTAIGRGEVVSLHRAGRSVTGRVDSVSRTDGYWRVQFGLDESPADWRAGQLVDVETAR